MPRCDDDSIGYWPDGNSKEAYCEQCSPSVEIALDIFGDQRIKAHYCINYE